MAEIDKKAFIDEACNLLNEAISEFRKAEKLFKKCGIEFCNSIDIRDCPEWGNNSNIQIYRGINKFEKIIGAKGYFRNDYITEKPATSRKYLDYKGLVFLQLGDEKVSRQAKFHFR